jgi:hypothetical protein
MKCKGCESGLPVTVAFISGWEGTTTARLHYEPGSDQPAGLCNSPRMDPIADEVVAWESEGGRAA